MLVHQSVFTIGLGEMGYVVGFAEPDDFPAEIPYGWRCGPAGDSSAVVLTTTDTGPLLMTVQVHDGPPPPEVTSGWEAAEEMSLLAVTDRIHLATLDPGDITDAWPHAEPPLRIIPPAGDQQWVRMRLYCQAGDPAPGVGDRGEHHLVQFWPAPRTPAVHPEITDTDHRARAAYAADRAMPVDDYTSTYTITYSGDQG